MRQERAGTLSIVAAAVAVAVRLVTAVLFCEGKGSWAGAARLLLCSLKERSGVGLYSLVALLRKLGAGVLLCLKHVHVCICVRMRVPASLAMRVHVRGLSCTLHSYVVCTRMRAHTHPNVCVGVHASTSGQFLFDNDCTRPAARYTAPHHVLPPPPSYAPPPAPSGPRAAAGATPTMRMTRTGSCCRMRRATAWRQATGGLGWVGLGSRRLGVGARWAGWRGRRHGQEGDVMPQVC